MNVTLSVRGLRELIRDLKQIDRDLPKAMRTEHKAIADVLVPRVRAAYSLRYPPRTGRGAASIRSVATQKSAGIRAGSARAPYLPGQEWGSRRYKQFGARAANGRFLYPTVKRAIPETQRRYAVAVQRVLDKAIRP